MAQTLQQGLHTGKQALCLHLPPKQGKPLHATAFLPHSYYAALLLSAVPKGVNLKKAHFQQGKLLGLTILRDEGQFMPMMAQAALSWACQPFPGPCQPCTWKPGSW